MASDVRHWPSTNKPADPEAALQPLQNPKEKKSSSPRRPQLFLLLGCLSLTWLGALVFLMHDIHPQHGSWYESVDYTGGDIDSIFGVESMPECRMLCEQHPRCLAFTWVKGERACWLKGEGYSVHQNPNAVSGSVNSSLLDVRRKAFNGSSELGGFDGQTWSDDDDSSYEAMHERERPHEEEEGEYLDGEESYNGVDSKRRGWRHWRRRRDPPHETTDDEANRYNDSTSFVGDFTVHDDIRLPADCEELCLGDGRWSRGPDKRRFLCLLRLYNASTCVAILR